MVMFFPTALYILPLIMIFMANKTADGKFRLADIVRAAKKIAGVTVEPGNRHRYVLKYAFAPVGNCALGPTTSTDRHLVPWFKEVTSYSRNDIYSAFRTQRWEA